MNKRKIFNLSVVTLLFLVLITSMLTSGMLAKYTSGKENDENARVATFCVDMKNSTTSLPLVISSSPVSFDVAIVNYTGSNVSEVTSKYEFEVTTLGNLPLKITIVEKSYDGKGTMATINDLLVSNGIMPATEKVEHIFTIIVEWDTTIDNYDDVKYSEEIDLLRVSFTGTQVD